MASRHSAARPKRAGENFARMHHHDVHGDDDDGGSGPDPKKVKFDVRNPSALAPDAREDDAILEADVIGGGAATKRGAVNLDGYDSDSDNETFDARAGQRPKGKGDPNLLEQLDQYDSKKGGQKGGEVNEDDDDEDDDMFAVDDNEAKEGKEAGEPLDNTKRKDKEVRFLEETQIEGQELRSKGGGHVRLDDEESSDDEGNRDLAVQEEGVDEEVGLGGLKRNAPKVEAFHMKEEQEEGRFDADGNYIRKAVDPDAAHDRWMDGVSKKEIKRAAAAHEAREAEARKQRMEDDNLLTMDILKDLILKLEKGETPLEALARLGKGKTKAKKLPKWRLKKQKRGTDGMDVDQAEDTVDPEQARAKASIDDITDAADKLLGRDHDEIYDEEREMLIREWQRETGEEWLEPTQGERNGDGDGSGEQSSSTGGRMWEFRWTDGRDEADKQGPFDSPTMKSWQDAGYFGEGVEFRAVGDESGWTRVASFA